MTGVVGALLQVVVVVGRSPLLLGLMRQVRAKLEGRAGAGAGQPWRDLRKLFRKEPITPRRTSEVFRYAPVVLFTTTLVVAVVAPFVTTTSAVRPVADLFAVVALLALGTVALALAGLDTATAFGGMGASREMTIIALVEPTLLVAILALSVQAGSTSALERGTAARRSRGSWRPSTSSVDFVAQWPRAAARTSLVTVSGWLIIATWELRISIVWEWARAAIARSASGGMTRSFFATRNQDGIVRQAGTPEGVTKLDRVPGRWLAAMTAAWRAGTSWAKIWWKKAGSM